MSAPPPSPDFERITRLAVALFDVPLAVLVPAAGLLPSARVHAARADLAGDALARLLAAGEAAAAGAQPDLPFHAAAPLQAPDGWRLGTLCLLDTVERAFDAGQQALLADLAGLAAAAAAKLGDPGEDEAALRHEQAWRARAATERRHKTFSLASHELRTPLASIIGFSELLLKREFDTATARELLEIVHAQAGLMSTLVNGVLDLARIEAGGRQALRIVPAPIDGILIQALASLDPLGQNARVHLDIAPGLPPVAGDTHRLQMAFAHVLSNSIRFSGADSPVAVNASLDAAAGSPALLVRVADSGIGMSAETRERLCEPFFRGPAAAGAPVPPGTGLGMAIFKEIIDAHGGRVEVESSPGVGTVVSVRLPLAGDAHG